MRPTNPPDVVLIHCHDLGRWLPVYGMPHVPAPNLASFAEHSIVFEDAHSTAPLCSPARGSLFTGMTPFRNGVQGLVHDGWRYRAGVLTAPERLRALGYHTTLIGLQHENVDPRVIGFDECFGLGFLPRTTQVIDTAERWLKMLEPPSSRKPVFLTVGTWEVHRPWGTEDYSRADPMTVDVPAYLPDNLFTRRDIAGFYGSIAQFDAGFGRLLAAVDATLPRENTMIIFTTDHGAAFPRAKSTLYDAGTGVSLIIRPPSSWGSEPRRISRLTSHLDILPTLLEVVGAGKSEDLEGESLMSVLEGGEPDSAERLIFTSKSYHDTYDPKRAARSSSFVYIRSYEAGPQLQLAIDLETSETRKGMGQDHLQPRELEELYDRRNDPAELHNMVLDPRYADVVARYAKSLDDWLDETSDPVGSNRIEPPPPRTRDVDALPRSN